jgi:hypothetical protein
MYQLSWNLGASTSCNTQGLPRHVQELLCFFIKHYVHKTHLNLVHDMFFLSELSVLVYKKMFLTEKNDVKNSYCELLEWDELAKLNASYVEKHDSPSKRRKMQPTECVVFTNVMLHWQCLIDYCKNPPWNLLCQFCNSVDFHDMVGGQMELSNIMSWPHEQSVKVKVQECVYLQRVWG